MPIQLNGTTICYDIPTGAIMMGPVSTMDGFLLCDGSQVSRTKYARLFAIIGTNFGTGDGSTTFNVPDYRGCFLRGLGGASAADMYTKQAQGLPDHRHLLNLNTRTVQTGTNFVDAKQPVTNGDWSGYASASNSIYGAADEVRPINYAVNYFIKY